MKLSKEALKELGWKVKKRRSLSKEDRIIIANKTNFRCAYCSCDLPKRYHIDHVEAFAKQGSTCDDSNLLAACPACNLFKRVLSVEQFRRELSFQAERAYETSVNFRMALKYKQISVKRSDIVFYFETLRKGE